MRRLAAAALVALFAVPASAQAVVGGRDASRPYPHMAALRLDGEFRCGASLVAPQIVLTAAHCLVDEDGTRLDAKRFSFTLGRRQLEGPGGETISAAEYTIHERFPSNGDPAEGFDVALVRLATPSATGQPIALADPAAHRARWAPGTRATVIGWGGSVTLVGPPYNNLQEVDVPIVADEECSRSLLEPFDARTMVCAGERFGGKDSCQGDSGGPLMVDDGAGRLIVAGIVSFGFGCGTPTQYGVYSRVGDRELYDWVVSRLPPPAVTAPAPTAEPKAKAKPKSKSKRKAAKRSCKKSSRRSTRGKRPSSGRRSAQASARAKRPAKRCRAKRPSRKRR